MIPEVNSIYIILLLVRKLVIWNLLQIKILPVIWIFQKLILQIFILGGNLEVRTEIIGNDTGNISYSMINVILKSYKM